MTVMLQSPLEDRFKLRVHRETEEGPVYWLTAAKGGVKLQPLKEGSCAATSPNNGLPAPGQKPPCGVLRPGLGANMIIEGAGVSAAALARYLTLILGRPVSDKTGIARTFDVLHLEYVRDDPTGNPASSTDSSAPSIFTAIQEQLGLKLEPAKGPVDILVIDRLERPSEN